MVSEIKSNIYFVGLSLKCDLRTICSAALGQTRKTFAVSERKPQVPLSSIRQRFRDQLRTPDL